MEIKQHIIKLLNFNENNTQIWQFLLISYANFLKVAQSPLKRPGPTGLQPKCAEFAKTQNRPNGLKLNPMPKWIQWAQVGAKPVT